MTIVCQFKLNRYLYKLECPNEHLCCLLKLVNTFKCDGQPDRQMDRQMTPNKIKANINKDTYVSNTENTKGVTTASFFFCKKKMR